MTSAWRDVGKARRAGYNRRSARSSCARAAKKTPADTDGSAGYRAQLEAAKSERTLQLLFKAARLLDEQALDRTSQRTGRPRLRCSHTSLLPHIDLEGTRITDLAERLGVTKQAASQLVDDLEQIGVLARLVDPDDARARRVVFTKLGREGLLEGLSLLRELEQDLAREIGKEPMLQLRAALVAILGRLT